VTTPAHVCRAQLVAAYLPQEMSNFFRGPVRAENILAVLRNREPGPTQPSCLRLDEVGLSGILDRNI